MHYFTSTNTKIQEVVKFCDRMSIFYFKKNVFRTFNVSHHVDWRVLNENSSRRYYNKSDLSKTRERHALVTSHKIREMKRIIKEERFETRAFIWQQLSYEVSLECTDRTIQTAMKTINYRKCVICRKKWVNDKTVRRRFDWVIFMLNKYSEKLHWRHIQFNDEMHFDWDSQKKLFIIRQFDERYCQDCIQKTVQSDAKDVKRHHC
jgi:hypothetical protein